MFAYYFWIEWYSSHPDDQFFERYKDNFIANSAIQNAFSYAKRSCLTLKIEGDCNVTLRILKRKNFGWVHLNCIDSHNLEFVLFLPPNFHFYHRIDEFSQQIYQIGTDTLNVDNKIIDFIECLNEFFQCYPSVRNGRFSTSKGGSRASRIITASENRYKYYYYIY